MQRRDGSLEKSARLIVLLEMQDAGRLTGLSVRKIAKLFVDTSYATISRDLHDVDRLRVTLRNMRRHTAPQRVRKETK